LGGGDIKMIEMAKLYSSFSNLGYPVDPQPFLEIKNYKGEVLYKNDCALFSDNCYEEQQLDPRAAYLITDILSDNKARTPAFGANSVLNIKDQQVAVKTGTTNNLRDNWTIGYTSDRLVLVWVGNNDNQSMSYVASGITGASPIWNETIRLTLDDERPHKFATPAGFIKIKVCTSTGTLPCQGCPGISEEVFVVGSEPTKACNPQYFAEKLKEKQERGEEINIVETPQEPIRPSPPPVRRETRNTNLLWAW
jgi:membrane carboxypeptidase/penicillin-binding protein